MWHRTAAPLMGPGPWVPPRARKRRVGGEGERDVCFGSPPTVFFFFFFWSTPPFVFLPVPPLPPRLSCWRCCLSALKAERSVSESGGLK